MTPEEINDLTKVISKKFNSMYREKYKTILDVQKLIRQELRNVKFQLDTTKNKIYFNNKSINIDKFLEVDAKIDAHAIGVQNVYNKMLELEEKQNKIERMLTTKYINKLLKAINKSKIEKIEKNIKESTTFLKRILNLFPKI